MERETERFVTQWGTIIITEDEKPDNLWLGISLSTDVVAAPDISVKIGPGFRRRIADTLLDKRGT